MMFNINMLMSTAHSEGFGINTDIFETNVLNLSVVIGVLVYYGRAAFVKRVFVIVILIFCIFVKFEAVRIFINFCKEFFSLRID